MYKNIINFLCVLNSAVTNHCIVVKPKCDLTRFLLRPPNSPTQQHFFWSQIKVMTKIKLFYSSAWH